MKKSIIILITIAVEFIILYLVSCFIGWNYIDTVFLGSILVLGISWLLPLYSNQVNNQFNAHSKAWTGNEGETIKPYIFRLNAVIIGQIIFMLISLVITFLYYFQYFVN